MEDFTGYLGYGDGHGRFFVAIHADWPVYPCPPGDGHALFDLAQFPVGTMFDVVDDIDRCLLLRARGYGERNPDEKDRYFVAAWHEDLVVLAQDKLVSGLRAGYERDWEQSRREKMRQTVRESGWDDEGDPLDAIRWNDGVSDRRLRLAPLENFDNGLNDDGDPTGLEPMFAVAVEGRPITVTDAGWTEVEQSLSAAEVNFPPPLAYIRELLRLELYDTAVREVAVTLESQLRDALGGASYGQHLVEQFIDYLLTDTDQPRSVRSMYRLRLRTFFKFVRNRFAHQRVVLARPEALALIHHVVMIAEDVAAVVADEPDGEISHFYARRSPN
ncbi:hypothetical protein ACWEKT_39870 [Nocardia takedensis]